MIRKEKYNAILVIIDRLTKYFTKKKQYIVDQLGTIMLKGLIQNHKILKKITGNRNKLFKSNYKKILTLLLETRLRLSMIYSFKSDREIEETN